MLHLRTLGGLSLTRDGSPVVGAASQRNRLAILAVIAAAGERGVSRDRLHSLFWPDSDTERARGALNQSLFAIRRDAAERDVVQGTAEIRLNPAIIRCDLALFSEAISAGDFEGAVSQYGGPFLDGTYIRDSAEFERWVEQERERHANQFREALRRLGDKAAAAGDMAACLNWRLRFAAADPLSALGAVDLMKAHLANGDSASALLHARRYRTLVDSELGAAPDPAVTMLEETIRSTIRPVLPEPRTDKSVTTGGMVAVDAEPGPNEFRGHGGPVPAFRTDSEPVASPSTFRPRRRVGVLVGIATALVVATAAFAAARYFTTPDLHGVVITSAPLLARPGDLEPLDERFRARLSTGIAELHLDDLPEVPVGGGGADVQNLTTNDVMAIARTTGARFIVVASVASDKDSLLLDIKLADAVDVRPMRRIEPLRIPRADFAGGIDRMRSRMMATLAGRADPLFARWGHAAALPTTWESLSALRSGIEVWYRSSMQVYGGRQVMPHLLSAATLDTASGTPLVWAAYLADSAESEEIRAQIAQSSRALGPWDRAMLAFDKANDDGDLYAAHAAAHQIMITAPNSEFRLDLAWSALIIGRAAEALGVLSAGGPDSSLLQDNLHYWRVMLNAHHALGNYEQELVIAEAGLRRNPDNRLFMQFKVRALSALHRAGEVEAICKQSLRYTAHDGWALQPCGQAVGELLAHGLPAEARRLSAHVERISTAAPVVGSAIDPLTISQMRLDIGDYDGAQRALVTRTAGEPGYDTYLDHAAFIAASRGDRAHVTKYLQQFDARPVSAENRLKGQGAIRHAQLAALLGDRDAAVSWLARAFREGFMWRHNVHVFHAYHALRDYPPFMALLKPVAGAEEVRASR